MIKFLDLQHQYSQIKEEIDTAIMGVIEKSAFVGGEALSDFENAFAEFQGAEHCVGVGNGTDALEIGIEALQLEPGSTIIVPANSFIASSEAVTRCGHKVRFADVDAASYTLSLEDVKRKLDDTVKGIVAVHLYGHPCAMEPLRTLADERGIKIIEDCAQAHGAEIDGARVGALGDLGTFSFYPGKNLGAYGDGGAIVTNDEALARRCRMIANHGRIDKYDHQFEGRNSRLDGLQAAVLGVKLRHLENWLRRRIEIASQYSEALSGVKAITLPQVGQNARHVFHLYVIRSSERDALAEHLRTCGVSTGVHYPVALPKLKAYEYLGAPDPAMFAVLTDRELLSLPMGEHLTDEEVATVAGHVRDFYG